MIGATFYTEVPDTRFTPEDHLLCALRIDGGFQQFCTVVFEMVSDHFGDFSRQIGKLC